MSTSPLIGQKSPGVVRIEALSAYITHWNRICIFFGVFLIAYAYGLDSTLRFAFQVRSCLGPTIQKETLLMM